MLVVSWIYKSLGNRCMQKPFKNVNLQLKNDMAINIPANYYLHESKHGLEKSKDKTLKVQLLYHVHPISLWTGNNTKTSQRLPHVLKIEILLTMKYHSTMCQSDLESDPNDPIGEGGRGIGRCSLVVDSHYHIRENYPIVWMWWWWMLMLANCQGPIQQCQHTGWVTQL